MVPEGGVAPKALSPQTITEPSLRSAAKAASLEYNCTVRTKPVALVEPKMVGIVPPAVADPQPLTVPSRLISAKAVRLGNCWLEPAVMEMPMPVRWLGRIGVGKLRPASSHCARVAPRAWVTWPVAYSRVASPPLAPVRPVLAATSAPVSLAR